MDSSRGTARQIKSKRAASANKYKKKL
jgi:hypothetical protein